MTARLTKPQKNLIVSMANVGEMHTRMLMDHDDAIAQVTVRLVSSTNRALTGLAAVDSVTPVAGDLVLLAGQTDAATRDIYVASAGTWTKLTRTDSTYPVLTPWMQVKVTAGTVYAGTTWELTTNGPITRGTTSLTFIQKGTGADLTLRTDIASVVNAKGASLIGIEDSATIYTATTVEAALAEVKVIANAAAPSATLAAVTNGNGASLIGIEDSTTIYTATNVEAALAEVKVIANAALPSLSIGKKTVTLTQADDLADLPALQTTLIKNVGTALPASARIIGRELVLTTPFSGGGSAAITVDVGGTDANGLVAAQDVFTGATGLPGAGTAGAQGYPMVSLSSQQVTVTITSDVDLTDLTAGSLDVTVFYVVLA